MSSSSSSEMAYFFWTRFRRDPPGVAMVFFADAVTDDVELLATAAVALASFSFIRKLLDSSSLFSSSSPKEAAQGKRDK